MDWVDYAWPMLAAASFMLGLMHAVLWVNRRHERSYLAFAVAAASVGAIALFELASFRAGTPAAMADVILYWHVAIATLVWSVLYATHVMYGVGSPLLGMAAAGTRLMALVLNFATGVNLNFEAVERVGHVAWLGADVAYPVGPLNPWAIVAQISNVLVVVYLAQTLYRVPRGSPLWDSALLVCGGWLLMVVTMLAATLTVVLGLPRLPLGTSPSFVVLVGLLSALLLRELFRAQRLDTMLRESEQRSLGRQRELELAASAARLGLWQWDMARGSFNQNATNALLLGQPAAGDAPPGALFAHAESPEEAERMFREAIAAPEYEIDYRVRRPDGVRAWIRLRGNVEHDAAGHPRTVRGVTIDVTRRREESGILRTLLESAPSALLLVEPCGTVRYANLEAARIFGYPPEELVGLPVEALVPHDVRELHLRERMRYLDDASPRAMAATRDVHGLRRDGEQFPIEARLSAVELDGELRVMVAVTDLSARKQLEYEMAMERESVAHLARVTMLGELSGSLAHELNQPLAAILSNAQAAQRILHRDPSDLEQVHEILADIVETDRRAGQVIGRLRGMLRREAREFVPLDVNEVVQECVRLMRNDLLNRRVSYRLNLMPGLPACRGDAIQLQQVLMNLIRNACDALPEERGERIVRVRTNRSDTGVCTEVVDTGSGIDDGMLERIFTPFETTKASGMGMGLAVCRTIIRAHGGRIWAENVKPRGARVSFELPVQG